MIVLCINELQVITYATNLCLLYLILVKSTVFPIINVFFRLNFISHNGLCILSFHSKEQVK